MGGLQQFAAPRREHCRNLVSIFLADEFIVPRLNLQERGIKRALRSVVRMEMESSAPVGLSASGGCLKTCESASPKRARNQGGSGALAETKEELAPAEIYRWMRLPSLAQSDVPRKVTRAAKLTFTFEPVKVRRDCRRICSGVRSIRLFP